MASPVRIVSEGNNVPISDTNPFQVSPYSVDEYGKRAHLLGDNAFKGALLTVTVEHHEIHCGDMYTAHHVEDLGNGATPNHLIITPDWGDPVNGNDPFGNQGVKVAHLTGEISGEAETSFMFFESPTVTANGNAVASNNRNRNSSNTDYLTIYEGATVSATGTELEHVKFGSGRGIGGSISRSEEWILKNNTTYLLQVTNDTALANYHTLRLQYYIHGGV